MVKVIYRPVQSVGFDTGNNRPFLVGGHWLAFAKLSENVMISATAKTRKTACAKLSEKMVEHSVKTGQCLDEADSNYLYFLAAGYTGYGVSERLPPDSSFDLDLDDIGD